MAGSQKQHCPGANQLEEGTPSSYTAPYPPALLTDRQWQPDPRPTPQEKGSRLQVRGDAPLVPTSLMNSTPPPHLGKSDHQSYQVDREVW